MDGSILSEISPGSAALNEAIAVVGPIVMARLNPQVARRMPRRDIARDIEAIV